MKRIFLGITGASGHAYAEALIRGLAASGVGVDLAVTGAGAKVLRHELGVEAGEGGRGLPGALEAWLGAEVAAGVRAFPTDAVEAPPSSGTAGIDAVVICPCSMGTLARVSVGFSSNLVERAADVSLKEGRPLVIVPRETPLSEIHLENMLRLARLGATVLPAMPGFYHHPKSLEDLVNHVVGKILDRLGVQNRVGARWTGDLSPSGGDPGEAGSSAEELSPNDGDPGIGSFRVPDPLGDSR